MLSPSIRLELSLARPAACLMPARPQLWQQFTSGLLRQHQWQQASPRVGRKPHGLACRANAAAAPAGAAHARLAELDLLPVITVQGYILPEVPAGTEASVFAVYDEAKFLQYVGFSKDLRASLRTVFARRPDKAHYFRALHLPKLDQQQMVAIRAAWFDENHGPPPGNKLPAERDAWQTPLQSTAISERGKQLAAEELAKQQVLRIRQRGCKEEFVANPELLPQGLVDFLAAEAIGAEELERQRLQAEQVAKSTRQCATSLDGAPATFDLFFARSFPTNGGYMFDVVVTFQDKESRHRVIVGKEFYEPVGLEAEQVVEKVFAFLIRKKQPRQTEGMLLSSQFPVNYFAVAELEQFFTDFAEEFSHGTEGGLWRFNRTQDYGYKGANEGAEQLSQQFALGDAQHLSTSGGQE